MSLPHAVAQILRDRVTLTVESIDRLYLNVYVPKLQRVLGVVGFFREQRGATFASSALMEPLTRAYSLAVQIENQEQKASCLHLMAVASSLRSASSATSTRWRCWILFWLAQASAGCGAGWSKSGALRMLQSTRKDRGAYVVDEFAGAGRSWTGSSVGVAIA